MSRPLAERMVALRDLYRQVPRIRCQGLCHGYCGAIGMSQTEREILDGRVSNLPALDGLNVMMLDDLKCPLLTAEGRCSQYQHRPLICRIWGVTPLLPCPHGCEIDGGPMSDEHARELLDAANRLTPREGIHT